MDFNLTPERRMVQDTLRRFLRDQYPADLRRRIAAGEEADVTPIWSDLADLGIIGALFDESQGGYGGSGFDISLVFEELGRAGADLPLLDTAVLCGGMLAEIDGSSHSDLLSQVIEGSVRLAFAHGEPGSRYDLDRVTSTARADESGIVLYGRKSVVFDAGSADHFVVSAREGDRSGISLFLVPADCSGLTIQSYPVIGGARAGEVTLDNLRLPETARLGLPGTALPYIETAAARANVAVMADTLGAMETVTDMTREYLMTRQQFGRPIGTFQALQHRFADMLIELEQARSAVINAAGHLDHPDRDRQISAARNLICRTGRLIAEESMQMQGGIAMTQEYDLAGFAKRIIMAEHRFGDADYHLERFIALGTV